MDAPGKRALGFRSPRRLLEVMAVIGWMLGAGTTPASVTLPTGFQEDPVFTGLAQPMSLAFGRDRQVYVAGKSGLIKRFSGFEDSTPDVVADLRAEVHDCWDRGLLSIALHPDSPRRM
jgi:hypothetical protein